MTLYFRLLLLYIKSLFKPTIKLSEPAISHFRVWPSDLDFLGHMTNSRYFNIMDAARNDLILRSGSFSKLRARGWFPVVVDETMQFRRALNPFVAFTVKTEIAGFDDRHFILQQTFLKQGKVVALGIVRTRFLGPNKQKVSPQEILSLVEDNPVPETPINGLEQERYHYVQALMNQENASTATSVN